MTRCGRECRSELTKPRGADRVSGAIPTIINTGVAPFDLLCRKTAELSHQIWIRSGAGTGDEMKFANGPFRSALRKGLEKPQPVVQPSVAQNRSLQNHAHMLTKTVPFGKRFESSELSLPQKLTQKAESLALGLFSFSRIFCAVSTFHAILAMSLFRYGPVRGPETPTPAHVATVFGVRNRHGVPFRRGSTRTRADALTADFMPLIVRANGKPNPRHHWRHLAVSLVTQLLTRSRVASNSNRS